MYVPAAIFVKPLDVALLFHKYVKGAVPPEMEELIAPVAPPIQDTGVDVKVNWILAGVVPHCGFILEIHAAFAELFAAPGVSILPTVQFACNAGRLFVVFIIEKTPPPIVLK